MPPLKPGDLVRVRFLSMTWQPQALPAEVGDTGTVMRVLGWATDNPERRLMDVFLWRVGEVRLMWSDQLTPATP